MDALQLGLILIGIGIIGLTLLFNWWQERKYKNQVNKSFSNVARDALLDPAESSLLNGADEEGIAVEDVAPMDFDYAKTLPDEADFSISITQKLHGEMPFDGASVTKMYEEVVQVAEVKQTRAEKSKNVAQPMIQDLFSSNESERPSTPQYAQAQPTPMPEVAQNDAHQALVEQAIVNPPDSNPPDLSAEVENETAVIEDEVALLDEKPHFPEDLNVQVDLIALLFLAENTSLDALKFAAQALVGFNKPVFVHALTAQGWQTLAEVPAGAEVTRASMSLQLADRAGAADRTTLNKFQHVVETLGLDLDALVEWQNTGDIVAAAQALDAFCMEVDHTIRVHLVHGAQGPFTGTKLRGLSEAQGMRLEPDAKFKYRDEAGHALFEMFNRDAHPFSAEMLRGSVVNGVTFQFDLTHVKNSTEVFNTMLQVAKQMEIGLNAQLVDEANKPLSSPHIEQIRTQLKSVHAKITLRNITPGGECALRLFS